MSYRNWLSFQGHTIRDDEGRPLYVVSDARADFDRSGESGEASIRSWTVWPIDPLYIRIAVAKYSHARQTGGDA